MKRSSVFLTCLAGALVTGLGVATLTAPASATTSGKSPVRGLGAYVKNSGLVSLRSMDAVNKVVVIGPFSAGSYVVSFTARVDTTDVTGPSADVRCAVVADRGLVDVGGPMFRFPSGGYLPLSISAAFTTTAPGSIAIRCGASDSGNPIPRQVAVGNGQVIVQRVSTVHSR
jgi:hypothetical protein